MGLFDKIFNEVPEEDKLSKQGSIRRHSTCNGRC